MVDDDRESVKAVEETLTSLTPKPSKIDRDRLMWLSGRASLESELQARHRSYLRPIVNCLSSVAAGMLLAFLVLRPATDSINSSVNRDVAESNSARPGSRAVSSAPAKDANPRFAAAAEFRMPQSYPPSMLSENASYLELRSSALAYGMEAFPDRVPVRSSAGARQQGDTLPTQQNLLREMLNQDGTGAASSRAG